MGTCLSSGPTTARCSGSLMTRRGLGTGAGPARDSFATWQCTVRASRYHSLWSNDEPAAAGLETLTQCAAAARGSARPAWAFFLSTDISHASQQIARLELDPAKLWVGIGSGFARRSTSCAEPSQSYELLRRDAHCFGSYATSAISPWWRNRRRCAAQLDAACQAVMASMGD